MKSKAWRFGKWVLMGLSYLVAVVLFAYMAFPYERLRAYAVAQYASQFGTDGSRLEIEGLSWALLGPGVVADGVSLHPAKAATEEESAPPPAPLRLDHVRASISPWGLLLGRRTVQLEFDGLGGSGSAAVTDSQGKRRLVANLEAVELLDIPQLASALGVPASGTIAGHIDVVLPDRAITKAEGTFELTGDSVMLGTPKLKIKGLLPAMSLGTLSVKGEVAAGRVKLDEFKAEGKDIKASATGGVRLRDRLAMSLAELDIQFEFSESYRQRDETTKVLFGEPGSKMPGLFDSVAGSHLTKRGEGSYEGRVTGQFARPVLRPAGSSAPSGTKGATRPRRGRGKSAGAEPADEPEATE